MLQSSLRIQVLPMFHRRGLRRTRAVLSPAIPSMLRDFNLRHDALLRRYECLVRRGDRMEARRNRLARQIRALDRAIAALESHPAREKE